MAIVMELLCYGKDWIDQTVNIYFNLTEQIKGEFIFLEHASRWLGQSVGISGRDKSFG
ncbi:hypothetical protein HanXRQr2_Chr08g0328251 [Helianthus annuus]|uniref:Uncharacterized protein n=1 Tax=Helianthus annuus TaxID=4232 RepID=A0A9K3NCH3_HELAN|nr:hypothetical protein HanXRQr2_Chr08g0328241 [Helianthus annuus]KAF5794453.1 hypothetical protein HanXRQr2_Chr08g0328251 [Helianthus annuus]